MAVERKNTEILDQPHQMCAEGTDDEKPKIEDIEVILKNEGWGVFNVDIWFDTMQGFWRWNCDILKLTNP